MTVADTPLPGADLQPIDNPFGPRLAPMSQVRSVTHVSGPGNCAMVAEPGLEPGPTDYDDDMRA